VTAAALPAYDDVAGLVLAAGAGRRMGTPKALLPGAVETTVDRLLAAGCGTVTVVLGAAAEEAALLVPDDRARSVVAEDWREGMGASLRRGLGALEAAARVAGGTEADAVLVTLVDLPDVGAEVMRRVLGHWAAEGRRRDALVRATYDGRPGHPVLLGREHWAPLSDELVGDRGAQGYLSGRRVLEVSCEDLATGRDLDRPEDLAWPV
jgi:CTP:molybdopterin cytidylyltransferase MocA